MYTIIAMHTNYTRCGELSPGRHGNNLTTSDMTYQWKKVIQTYKNVCITYCKHGKLAYPLVLYIVLIRIKNHSPPPTLRVYSADKSTSHNSIESWFHPALGTFDTYTRCLSCTVGNLLVLHHFLCTFLFGLSCPATGLESNCDRILGDDGILR